MLIKLIIDRLEGDKAVLLYKTKEIIWPLELLPKNSKEGDVLSVGINEEKKNTQEKNVDAKTILNEILNPDN